MYITVLDRPADRRDPGWAEPVTPGTSGGPVAAGPTPPDLYPADLQPPDLHPADPDRTDPDLTDPADLDPAALELELATLAGHLAAATARFLVLLGAFDGQRGYERAGLSSTSAWLAWRCAMSPSAAREQTRVARRLRELPAVRTAFTQGRVSFSKVRALTRVATPTTETTLLDTAASATAAQLDRLCRGLATAATADAAIEQAATAHLHTSWTETGTLRVRGELTAEQGATLLTALAVLREQPPHPTPASSPGDLPGDAERDAAALSARADAEALAALARHALDTAPHPAPTSAVHVVLHATRASLHGLAPAPASPATDLGATDATGATDRALDPATATTPAPSTPWGNASAEASPPLAPTLDPTPAPADPGVWGATVAGGPGLHRQTARRLSCSASAEDLGDIDAPEHPDRPAIATNTSTMDTSTTDTSTTDDGRGRHRAPTRRQRRALLQRDGGCRFPGCTRRRGLDAHHLIHWADGGRTLLDNLVLLCGHHHVALHEGGWVLRWATRPGALLTAVHPDGRVLLSAPPLTGSATAATAATGITGITGISLTGRQTGDPLHLGYAVAVLST